MYASAHTGRWRITLSPSSASVAVGATVTFTANLSPSNATNTNITWTSANSNIATVSGGVVTGRSTGTTTITASTSNGKSDTCQVTVTGATSGIEYAVFPMDLLNISQGVNGSYSHQGSNAIDIIGNSMDYVYAPFDGTIIRFWMNTNTIWFCSDKEIFFANGTKGLMTVQLTHMNDSDRIALNIYEGKKVKQGEKLYKQGRKGPLYITGDHVHLEVAPGYETGWYQDSYGHWQLPNSIPPYNAFYLKPSIVIINGCGYPWKYLPQ